MKSSLTIVCIISALLIPIRALAAPGIPHQFYGTVNFTNGAAPDGLTVEAKTSSGVVAGVSATKDGKYGYPPKNLLFVTDANDGTAKDMLSGQEIRFFVSGIDTGAAASFSNDKYSEKNLAVNSAIGTISKLENDVITNQTIIVSPQNTTIVKMGDNLSITIFSTVNTSAVIEKIEKLSSGNVAVFSGKNFLNAYEIKISGENLNISVTIKYDDTGIDEDTIAPYRFDGVSWAAITSPAPTINKTANTITFTISSGQTVYGIFGSAQSPAGGTGGGGGASDTTAPLISDIKVTAGNNTATITWKTNETSLSWLIYGKTTAYGKEVKTATYIASHSVTLQDLSPETVYHYQIKSKDNSGNIGSENDKTFTTLAKGVKIIGDINNDAKVNKYDFALMMSAWGKTGTNSSDLNNDNKVDKYDFALLMLNWSTI